MTSLGTDAFTGTSGSWAAGWTTATIPTGGSATLVTNQGQEKTGSATTYAFASRIAMRRSASSTQANVVQKASFIFTGEVFPRIWARADTSMIGSTGYTIVADPSNTSTVTIEGYNGFSSLTLTGTTSISFAMTAGTKYWMEFGVVGTTIQGRVWQDGNAVPAWQLTATESTLANGSYGLGVFPGNAGQTLVNWDDYTSDDVFPASTFAAAGTSAIVLNASGTVTARDQVSGTSPVVIGVAGNVIRTAPAASTSAIVFGTAGNVSIIPGNIKAGAGTVPIVFGTAGAITAREQVAGSSPIVIGTSGSIGKVQSVSGTASIVIGVSGATVVTGKPGQGDEVLVLFDPDEVLTQGRVTIYQFDLLDSEENLIGQLQGVDTGEIDIDAYSAVKGTGTITVYDDPRYSDVPDSQPDFLGTLVTTPTGAGVVADATGTTTVLSTTTADGVDISLGDQFQLTDNTGALKEATVFTVLTLTPSGGHTLIGFNPPAATAPISTDQLVVILTSHVQIVDWLNLRVRPMIRIQRLGGGDDPDGALVPAGVFLCAAPVEKWNENGLQRDVELVDKLSILDQDIASGDPAGLTAYTAVVGANIIGLVQSLIGETGERFPAIQADTKVLTSPLVWDIGTTRLKIINDLLDAAGYFSLWCDGYGQYQAVPYVTPANRTPVYESIAPFSDGPDSLMDPAWTRDRDIYSVPNRYLVVSQGDGTNPALTSVATNTDPFSPYSFSSRGRWITTVEVGVEALTQGDLDTIAASRLATATSVTNQITLDHIFLPDLHINSVVHFVNPGSGLDIYCYVVNTTIPLDPTKLCTTVMRVVA